ncbi:MAG: uroporphyrinogen-III decarboxylase-like protein [Chloroflexi bacterium]|nr:uroporphyrinogen-III decarboxylase-like protein [Chloroflexota bacterium]
MPKETMTSRERWLAVLTRQTPDRVPMDYWATPEASAKLIKHLGLGSLSEHQITADLLSSSPRREAAYRLLRTALDQLHVDFVIHVGPRYIGPPAPAPDTDIYGVRYKMTEYGTADHDLPVYSPLEKYTSVEEIESNYTWPSPDWWDYSGIADQIKGWEDHPIQGGGSEPFLFYKYLRGEEQGFVDLALNPEIVHYILDKLFDLAYENTCRIYEQIPDKVMLSYVAEDLGGQDNLLYSPKHINTYPLPRMKRMMDLAHEGGAFVFHHDDGNCRRILPSLIEAGINILNPIQWRSKGMEREGLKQDFGDKLIFHGAMDNQYTLPFGTVDEVRQEVRDNLRILGAGGGYIIAPCHNIQDVGPAENVVAMYAAGYEYGWT